MNRFRVLALGNEQVTRRLAASLGHSDTVELICEPDLVEAMIRLKTERFALALVDGYMPDLAASCFRISCLHRTPIGLVTKNGDAERYRLRDLDVDGYVREDSSKSELHSHFREISQRDRSHHDRVKRFINVLVIENDPGVLKDIKLSFHFYWPESRSHVVSSHEEGIRLAARQPFDVIILGFEPTGMTGFQTLRQLRAVYSAPILVMNETAEEDFIVEAVKCGATAVLCKPFRQVQLIAKVRQSVRRGMLQASPRSAN